MEILKYYSYSGIQKFHRCPRAYELGRNPEVKARERFAATVMGGAVHEAIRQLHQNPGFGIEPLIRENVEMIIAENDQVPVKWGEKAPYDKEGRIGKAIRMVTVYWALNQGIDLRSSERWFFLTLDAEGVTGSPIQIRGRFDQLIADDNRLMVRELKTGADAPDIEALKRDWQTVLQGYALKNGIMALADNLGYVSEKDENYHVHDFKQNGLDPRRFVCSLCGLEGEKIGEYPAKIVYYALNNLDPGKKDFEMGSVTPKQDPEYIITPDSESYEGTVRDIIHAVRAIQVAEKDGHYPRTMLTGYQSPCEGCMVSDHCDGRCSVSHKEKEIN
jgi:hypothetical protein